MKLVEYSLFIINYIVIAYIYEIKPICLKIVALRGFGVLGLLLFGHFFAGINAQPHPWIQKVTSNFDPSYKYSINSYYSLPII